MAKSHTLFVCQQCGFESLQWLGKCSSCGAWNSLVETPKETHPRAAGGRLGGKNQSPQKLGDVNNRQFQRLKTKLAELNRVLGGGLVPGSVVLLAGDPGIGKSTLLLETAGELGGLYVSGEESLEQIKMRAERLKIRGEKLFLLAETSVENILGALDKTKAKDLNLVIIDSIQTMWAESLSGTPGSVGQVRESAAKLLAEAKRRGFPLILVGHVTKEGVIAGPMILAHMVDTVLYFEGEKYQALRLLRAIKNRFGPTDEVGIFQMTEEGVREVENPSSFFLSLKREKLPGSSLVMTMEGTRPILGEIQSLVSPTKLPIPRRTASGLDINRLQLMIAILQKKLNLPLFSSDIFANMAGGIRVFEPAVDLGICLAMVSSFKNKPLPLDLVAIGEVGLLGEIRPVSNLEHRIKEAQRLGLKRIISAKSHHFLGEIVSAYF